MIKGYRSGHSIDRCIPIDPYKTVAFIHYLQRNIKDIEVKHKWKKDSVLCLYQARSYYRCDEKRAEWDFHCDTIFGFDSEEREKALN